MSDVIFTSLIISTIVSAIGAVMIKIAQDSHAHQLNREIERLKGKIGFSDHVSKQQFDKEFDTYQEIWEKLLPAQISVLSLRPILDQIDPSEGKEARMMRRLKQFYDNGRELFSYLEKNKPFIDEVIYKKVSEILDLAKSEAIDYEHLDPNDDFQKYWGAAKENQKKLEHLINEACELIRKRLNNIQVRE